MSERHTSHPEPGNHGRATAAVILAAGRGTRMHSDLPKVLHEVAGRPMVWWVAEAAREAGAERIIIVIGYGGDEVRRSFDEFIAPVEFVEQREQLGTGHAVQRAQETLRDFEGDVFVLAGDGPLIRPATLERLLRRHRETDAAGTLATSVIDNPTGYGRIVRTSDGEFDSIVEEKNATDQERRIREVNPSYYCFDRAALFEALNRVEQNSVSGEFYLTDVPALLKAAGLRVEVIDAVPPEDVLSINTPQQLAEVDRILTSRLEART